jgi:hypothetical protein
MLISLTSMITLILSLHIHLDYEEELENNAIIDNINNNVNPFSPHIIFNNTISDDISNMSDASSINILLDARKPMNIFN